VFDQAKEPSEVEGGVKTSMAKMNHLYQYTKDNSRHHTLENINASAFNETGGLGFSEVVKETQGEPFEVVNMKDKLDIEMGWKTYMIDMEKAFRSMQVSLDYFKK